MIKNMIDTQWELDEIFNTYYQDGEDKCIDSQILLGKVYASVGKCIRCEYLHTNDCPLKDAISEVDLNTWYCASFDRKED